MKPNPVTLVRAEAPTDTPVPKHVVIVSPIYNERESLAALLQEIGAALAGLRHRFTVLLVDDGSDEETSQLLDETARNTLHLAVIHLTRNFGHQAALTAGLDEACRLGADAAICMDADLQHPPRLLPELIRQWEAGYDVVYTIRDDPPHLGLFKRFTSRVFYALVALLSAHSSPRGAADFRLLGGAALRAFTGLRERARFLRGLSAWIGFRQVGIHYTPAPRFGGRSRFTVRKMLRLAVDGVVATTTLPLCLTLPIGMVATMASVAYILYVAVAAARGAPDVRGSGVLVAVLIFGSTILNVLGVMGLYLARIFDEVRGRPIYIVRSSVGVSFDDPAMMSQRGLAHASGRRRDLEVGAP